MLSEKEINKLTVLNKLKSYLNYESLVENGDKILLGVSGGPDSLAMLDLFYRIRESFNLELIVFHLNHCFREEATSEAKFVEQICNEYDIKVFIEKCDVPQIAKQKGLSSEEAAREVRLDFMTEKASQLNVDKIALAHHKDDLVETIFLNLVRGSGLKGLSGISPCTEIRQFKIIHPLLSLYQEEIEDYCKERNLNPRRDPTNQQTIYTRNKVRHKIIPYIEQEINPSVKEVMVRMSNLIREEDDYLDKLAKKSLQNVIIDKNKDQFTLSLDGLKNLPPVIRRRVIRKSIYYVKNEPANLYYKHYQDIDELIMNGETGKMLDLPDEIKVKRLYDKIIIKKGDFINFDAQYCYVLKFPEKKVLPGNKIIETDFLSEDMYQWKDEAIKDNTCLFDFDKVSLPLKVRNRRNGDKFKPLGMKGIKKLKDFFIDEKIPRNKREKIPIIVDGNNIIVWIASLRMNEDFKITGNTKVIGRIKLYDGKEKLK